MKRKVCVVTGSRAEYGLLRLLMTGIRQTANLELQLVVTGMHLLPQFGSTYREIEADGFKIDRHVEMPLNGDTSTVIAKSLGIGVAGLAEVFADLQPDLLVLLGDRFEIFAAAAAATLLRIPIAHLHGGELTEGAIDEAFRHSITKMAHLHFVAAEEYRNRVIQLGEHPSRVFNVGGLGIDNIKSMRLLARSELEAALGFSLGNRSLLVTFHPVTLETMSARDQIAELLSALHGLNETQLIFTAPNADMENQVIRESLEQFVATHSNARLYASLGALRYLSCLQYVDGVVGNSSSGLIEVPSFSKGTVNIGDRQKGRLKAKSVIDCAPDRQAISLALARLFSNEFRSQLINVDNPYGDGGAVAGILKQIAGFPLKSILKKSFYSITPSAVRCSS